jgi:hypothetical protein
MFICIYRYCHSKNYSVTLDEKDRVFYPSNPNPQGNSNSAELELELVCVVLLIRTVGLSFVDIISLAGIRVSSSPILFSSSGP